jgi:hypothetical protein
MASTGSSPLALMAGMMPAMIPTIMDDKTPMTILANDIPISKGMADEMTFRMT